MIWETQDDSFPYRPESFQEAPEMKVSLAAVCKFEKKKKKSRAAFQFGKNTPRKDIIFSHSLFWLLANLLSLY